MLKNAVVYWDGLTSKSRLRGGVRGIGNVNGLQHLLNPLEK